MVVPRPRPSLRTLLRALPLSEWSHCDPSAGREGGRKGRAGGRTIKGQRGPGRRTGGFRRTCGKEGRKGGEAGTEKRNDVMRMKAKRLVLRLRRRGQVVRPALPPSLLTPRPRPSPSPTSRGLSLLFLASFPLAPPRATRRRKRCLLSSARFPCHVRAGRRLREGGKEEGRKGGRREGGRKG